AYRGMLDPFNIFRSYERVNASEEDGITLACELAKSVLSELFGLNTEKKQRAVLDEIISEIKLGGYEAAKPPSMMRIVEMLEAFDKSDPLYDDAYMLARQLKPLRNAGMAQLFIGNGTEKAIRIDNRLNILQIQNLKMPSHTTSKEDYTEEERVSGVLMMVIAAFTRRFVHSHRNRFKVVLFDESWMLGRTAEGEKLMSYVARMSRSLYASLILNGHSVTDLPNEGIRNTITYKFCFKTGSIDEAKRMLDFLKMECTKNNIDMIMGLGNGECLFQDLAGRVGKLQFDAVFADIIDIFSTTPVDTSELQPTADEEQSVEELEELNV
ncbi:MAG: ATP-binding protein, partial [Oscillospiraceae bacterium]|nr:ATP-binding protein [Oscillospiraceae bacterium]